MRLPTQPAPAGEVVIYALSRLRVLKSMCPQDGQMLVDNDCPDPTTVGHKDSFVRAIHPLSRIVRRDFFGGAVKLSPACPDYRAATAAGMLEEFAEAVQLLDASTIMLGCHGEHCGLCQRRGITVAQRIWLTVDARRSLLSAAAGWIKPPRQVGCTYHRRYRKGDAERHKTRLIDHDHPLFTSLNARVVGAMSDRDFLHLIAPDLERLAI